MLRNATPESVGLRSEDLADLLSLIEKRKLHMHSLLVMRGDSVVLDAYWAAAFECLCRWRHQSTSEKVLRQ